MQVYLIYELRMQPGGLLIYMKMAWISKKQYILYTEDYKNETNNGKLEKIYK